MMTTASIDLNLDVSSGGLAAEAPVGGVPVGGADGAAFSSRPDVQAVAAFERALAGPISENAALTREIQKAIASLDAAFPLRASASPCENPPLPTEPVAVGLTRSRGETEVLGENVSSRLQVEVDSRTPPQAPSHPLRASEPPCENSPLPSEPVVADLTRSHGATEVLGDRMKPVSEVSTPSPLPTASTSATSAALRETSSHQTAPQAPTQPLRASEPPCENSPLPSEPVVVDLTRSHGATEDAEALVAAGVAPPVVPPPVASVASEEPSTPALAPVDVVRTQASQPLPPTQVLVEAAQAVADTLLVSPGLLRGQGEVVVRLRPDVLEGTEVRIAVTGRQLEVVFQPTTVDMAVLLTNCRTQIATHLAAKIAMFNVSVDVRKKRA